MQILFQKFYLKKHENGVCELITINYYYNASSINPNSNIMHTFRTNINGDCNNTQSFCCKHSILNRNHSKYLKSIFELSIKSFQLNSFCSRFVTIFSEMCLKSYLTS